MIQELLPSLISSTNKALRTDHERSEDEQICMYSSRAKRRTFKLVRRAVPPRARHRPGLWLGGWWWAGGLQSMIGHPCSMRALPGAI